MKKLLITSMAAVAIGLYAKADFTANVSFEEYTNEGPLFQRQTDNQEAYDVTDGWVTDATPEDGIFTVTNIANYVGAGTHETVSRPIDATPNVKALAIDTSKPLMRTVHTDPGSSDALTEEVFFDSVVQFTATDAKPTPSNDDKLMVWLYASDDVDNDNPGVFGETTPTTNLVITAGYNESGTFVVTNYLTGVEIAPDSWHRLTIKSFKDSGFLKFNVWVDKTPVNGGTESDFISLQYASENADVTLKGVAFEGKGVVDDLVFTTEAPEFAEGGGDSDNANVCISINNLDAIDFKNVGVTLYVNLDTDGEAEAEHVITTVSTNILLKVGDAIKLEFGILDSYTLDKPTGATYSEEDGIYIVEYNELTSIGATIEIVATSTGGGDNGPTVGDTTYATEEALKAVVKSGTAITVPSGWTVDGKVLKKADGTPFATFEYYNLTQNGNTVTATLDQKAAAPFAEATDLTDGQEVFDLDETMDDESPAVGIHIKTYSGLWYGLDTATELGDWGGLGADDWVPGNGSKLQLKAAKPAGNAAFFMILVRDTDPAAE